MKPTFKFWPISLMDVCRNRSQIEEIVRKITYNFLKIQNQNQTNPKLEKPTMNTREWDDNKENKIEHNFK